MDSKYLQWRVRQLHAAWVEASNDARRYGQIVEWVAENNPRLLALCPFKTDGGGPTSHREHATDGSPCWCDPERFDYTNDYVKQLEERQEEAFQMARAVLETAQRYLRIGGETVTREAQTLETQKPDGAATRAPNSPPKSA